MAVDLQWGLLTNASANLGNALVQGAGAIRQRRETARDRGALTNYLANPTDQATFSGFAERNPAMAFQIRDDQLQRARQLRADQREQLTFVGRLVRNVRDEASYQQARRLAQQAGIDVTNVPPNYDPQFVGQLQALDRQLNRVAPVSVAEGGTLIDPETGAVVGRGNPPRPRYYPVQPGGRLELDPSYQGPTTDSPQPGPVTSEAPAFQPAPAGAPSEYGSLPSGSPLSGGGQNVQIVRVNTPQEAQALPPGTLYMTPDGRQFVR